MLRKIMKCCLCYAFLVSSMGGKSINGAPISKSLGTLPWKGRNSFPQNHELFLFSVYTGSEANLGVLFFLRKGLVENGGNVFTAITLSDICFHCEALC